MRAPVAVGHPARGLAAGVAAEADLSPPSFAGKARGVFLMTLYGPTLRSHLRRGSGTPRGPPSLGRQTHEGSNALVTRGRRSLGHQAPHTCHNGATTRALVRRYGKAPERSPLRDLIASDYPPPPRMAGRRERLW